MGEIVVAMLLVALIVAVQITDGLATRKEMKFLKERTDDLLLRTHRLEHPPKKLGTTAGEISVDVILNKEEFDEQIDEITEDLDAIYNQVEGTLKNARELRSILENMPAADTETKQLYADGRRIWPPGEKWVIVEKLFEVLKLCDYTDAIARMEYIEENGDEYVKVFYHGRSMKKIDVTADSGFAMIKDIIKGIERGGYE